MREHPIPQDVTGYRFHIIGNMTLKQFVEVAAGVVGAVILYNTNLVAAVKWPLMLASGGLGALIAWVPFEERPLDHWLTVFFNVLYHPTKFFWRKQAKIPEPFLFKPRQDQVNVSEVVDLTPARRARIQEYLTSVETAQPKDDWETAEQSQIAAIMQSFDTVQVDQVSAIKTARKPTLNVRVRELQSFSEPISIEAAEPAVGATSAEPTEPEAPTEPVMVFSAPQPEPEAATHQAEVMTPTGPEPLTEEFPAVEELPIAEEPTVEEVAATAPATVPAITPTATPPITPAVTVTTTNSPFLMNTAPQSAAAPTESVTTNSSLPFPTQPTIPNKLVGMIQDSDGKLVPNAIVEIKNLQGLVARAVKTNALGQFFITTPLENGTYVMTADKAGLQFDAQRLTLTGQIVAPLQLTGQLSPQVTPPPLA